MTELEQLKQQLEKQEKLASLGMLSAGIAHEIQNPLNFVINFSKMSNKLLDDLTDVVEDNAERLSEADREDLSDIVADLKENMTQIMENGERAVSIIQGILLVSRGKENEFVPTDVCHIVKEYVRLSYHAMRANCLQCYPPRAVSGRSADDYGYSSGFEPRSTERDEQCLLCCVAKE